MAIPPFEYQELPADAEWLVVDDAGVMPKPAFAEAVTTGVGSGSGLVVLKPEGNDQVAILNPQVPVPGGGSVLTVRVSVANFPVSVVPTKTSFVVLV